MRIVLSLACLLVLGLAAPASAQNVPESGGGSGLSYTCSDDEEGTRECSCVGVLDCRRLERSGQCRERWSEETDWEPDMTCSATGCTCEWATSETLAPPRRSDHDPNVGLARLSGESADRETMPAEEHTRRRDQRASSIRDLPDGTSNTLLFDEADALFGANVDAASEDQTEIISPNSRRRANNRRTDGQAEADRLRRSALQAANEEPRQNEVVPARRGSLIAPSGVTLSEVDRTSLTLEWHDNSRWEFGVEVQRGTPTRERGGINYHWRRVFNVEERVEIREQGTGMRSDGDDGLTPATAYCYRLRAYRDDVFSDYSTPTCTQTLP
jgi:hypothetical protein